jgi:hypothetical protein
MDAFGPDRVSGEMWAKNGPAFRQFRPSVAVPPVGLNTPIKRTRVFGDGQVHFWIVDRDGRAEQGQYLPGLGTRGMNDGTTA